MFSGPAAFKLQANCCLGAGSAVPKLAAGFNLQPRLAGGDAKAAAEKAKGDILEFIKYTITDEEQYDFFLKNLEVKYVGEDGLLKTFK